MNPRGSNSPPASQDNDEGLPQKPDTMSGYFLVNEGRQGLAARSTGVRSESNPAVGFESHRPRSSSPGTGGKDPVQEGTLSTDLQAASNDPARDVSPGKKTNGTSDSREESKTSPGVILHSNLRDLEVRIASKTSTSTSTSTIIGVVESDKLAAMNKHRLSNANSGGVDTDVEMGSEHGRNELAIAIEVDEEDGDFIASAVEYDPDSKPPLYRNRRFRLYSILCFLFLVMLAIGITGLSTKNEVSLEAKAEAASPIASETNRVGSEDIIEQLELIVGAEVLNDPSSAEYRAKEWIIDVDPLQLGSQDIGLSQRYVLAVLYFKLHEDGDWRSCNAPSESDPSDICNYQKQVSIFPREFRSVASSRWLSGDHECRWAGLGCDDFNQLRTIDLTGQDIQGTLPVELTNFQLLQGIGLSWNKFRGSIPEEIGEMPHLLNLELHYNQLSGSLPSNLENSKNLQLVNLGSNALTGSIPESIGHMSNIKGLFLQDNSLTGAIPSSLSQVSLLSKFYRPCGYSQGIILTPVFCLDYSVPSIEQQPSHRDVSIGDWTDFASRALVAKDRNLWRDPIRNRKNEEFARSQATLHEFERDHP